MQHDAVFGPELDLPVAGAIGLHRVATEYAVPRGSTGINAKVDRLLKAIAVIPTMLKSGGVRGLDLRVEEQLARRNRSVWGIAEPVLELSAELRFGDSWSHG